MTYKYTFTRLGQDMLQILSQPSQFIALCTVQFREHRKPKHYLRTHNPFHTPPSHSCNKLRTFSSGCSRVSAAHSALQTSPKKCGSRCSVQFKATALFSLEALYEPPGRMPSISSVIGHVDGTSTWSTACELAPTSGNLDQVLLCRFTTRRS